MSDNDTLVTVTIKVYRNGHIDSNIETHDNSYNDVAVGLAYARKEIQRTFDERKNCPYHPSHGNDPRAKVIRG